MTGGWSMLELLLHGAPWEAMPEDRARVLRAARHHADNPRLTQREREYIRRVWLTPEVLLDEIVAATGGELLPEVTA